MSIIAISTTKCKIVVVQDGSIVPISAELLHIRRDDGDSKYFHHI